MKRPAPAKLGGGLTLEGYVLRHRETGEFLTDYVTTGGHSTFLWHATMPAQVFADPGHAQWLASKHYAAEVLARVRL